MLILKTTYLLTYLLTYLFMKGINVKGKYLCFFTSIMKLCIGPLIYILVFTRLTDCFRKFIFFLNFTSIRILWFERRKNLSSINRSFSFLLSRFSSYSNRFLYSCLLSNAMSILFNVYVTTDYEAC